MNKSCCEWNALVYVGHSPECYNANATERNAHAEGYGKVTFKRIDGHTVTFDNVRVDSIGPGAMPYGVIGFETDTEDIVSVPFVESWTVEYRL